ncbi:PTS sugar transporter subunit IIB [Oenococcus sp.]|uniref:PTS sugar transporter subunit IIB n=1 Tax=Oenococcus sp. TaxID=1979414 RepID=UPI0039EAB528
MLERTIMLCCAAGMSTSLLVSKMQKAAREQNKDVNIFATSANEADQELDTRKIDCVLLGPQIRYMVKDFQTKLAGRNNGQDIPVSVIDMQSYGTMNGTKVLAQAYDLIDQ